MMIMAKYVLRNVVKTKWRITEFINPNRMK